ncbi:unnamed protein product [Owenia fusiformis]|uniref:Uncharacterized protein n=1 Tax=Owenia fusiformis TaxID=6347 RepID=A0A8J1T4V7_OWEFU|nr:unnamed protein product [Owenia fusiformis]
MAAPILKWKRVTNTTGPCPRPRHGHRAVAIKDLMVVFGGGNEGIVDELHVFNTATGQWFVPAVRGDIPPGCAAYGIICDGTRILIFGGMVEYGKYSNEVYELQASRWEWKRLKPKPPKNAPPPCPRLGHSFTLIGNKAYLFGGLANDSEDPKNNIPRYLNDCYTLELKPNSHAMTWDLPLTNGSPPPPRESHSAAAHTNKETKRSRLFIYGGMSGCRLGDLWQLEVDTLTWCKPVLQGIAPLPRSLHSSTVIGNRLFVFGGWVPLVMDDVKVATHEKEWKCTNTLASLNLESMTWEPLAMEVFEDALPRARAGHCAVAINTRLYVWSGRDGYRKAWNNQVCFKDLWFLESEKPPAPTRVQLVRASTATLEVCWGAVPTADAYLLQLQKYDIPPSTSALTPTSVSNTASNPLAKALSQSPQITMVRAPGQQIIRSGITPAGHISMTPPGQRQVHVQRQKSPITVGGGLQGLKVISASSGQQVITMQRSAATTATTQMSGIAALAAAAGAMQKISTPGSVVTPTPSNTGVKVLTPTIVTPQGVKVNQVQKGATQTYTTPSGQTIQLPQGTTILKTNAQGQVVSGGAQGKQIITVRKSGASTTQPQIVTLVKTTQGMTVASNKTPIPQGATIVKLVTSQAGGQGKPTTIITTQAGSTPSNIMGISSVQPQTTYSSPKTIIKTHPQQNIVNLGKSGNFTGTSTIGGKQTIVIAAPKSGSTVSGTPTKLISSMPKLGGTSQNQTQFIVVSRPSGMATSTIGGTRFATAGGKPIKIQTMPGGGQRIITSSIGQAGKPTITIVNTQASALAASLQSPLMSTTTMGNSTSITHAVANPNAILAETTAATESISQPSDIPQFDGANDTPPPEDNEADAGEEDQPQQEEEQPQLQEEQPQLQDEVEQLSTEALANLEDPTAIPLERADEAMETDLEAVKDEIKEEEVQLPEQAQQLEQPDQQQIEDDVPLAEDPLVSQDSNQDMSDPLTTLASAAISTALTATTNSSVNKEQNENGINGVDENKEDIKPEDVESLKGTPGKKDGNQWYDVGIIKQTSCVVSHYHLPAEAGANGDDIDVVSVPDHSVLKRQELLPGTAYKFRVAGINACGRGPWSEISAFKTCLPGYPGAPSAIKISKSVDGAHLSWEPPQNTAGRITEYSVYLAVRNSASQVEQKPGGPAQLAFVRVFCGPTPSCVVTTASLASAHIDYTTKPAIIFRIAARNEKGYGPATQVRWLQDAAMGPVTTGKVAVKRTMPLTEARNNVGQVVKRVKIEGSGDS